MAESKTKSESEWRAILTPEQVRADAVVWPGTDMNLGFGQFRVIRQKGTEPPGTGKYEDHSGEGVYVCAGCATPLYKSDTKFKSECGWPAFFDGNVCRRSVVGRLSWVAAIPGAVSRHEDRTYGMVRTEITCTACGGHLGHVFKGEGFRTPSTSHYLCSDALFNKERWQPTNAIVSTLFH